MASSYETVDSRVQQSMEQSGTRPLELVCIGFGVTALATALALHERKSLDSTLFLESQPQASWQPCPEIPASYLRTSFLNDLVTTENPRSKFTFINYLHSTNRLTLYANSSQLRPSRELFTDYLRWCADHLPVRIGFSKVVTAIQPVTNAAGVVSSWKTFFTDRNTGKQDVVEAKQVLCSIEPQPYIPSALAEPTARSSVVHSANCRQAVASVLKQTGGKARIAIIGDGQSAAEVFEFVQSTRGSQQAVWFTQDAVLTSTGSSAFVLDAVRRPATDAERMLPPELRRKAIQGQGAIASNHAIDDAILMGIYDSQYQQSVKQTDPSKWQYQIKFRQQLVKTTRASNGQVSLSFTSLSDTPESFADNFDLVIAATGYDKTGHKPIMQQLSTLIDGHNISVNRDYQINFRSGLLAKDCGVWLQGAFRESDDVEDAVFAILAERSRRIAESIIQQRRLPAEGSAEEGRARL
ncbi:hypothetical protein DV735_g1275, partial [Chaetothyriales sp. CBS 134920]